VISGNCWLHKDFAPPEETVLRPAVAGGSAVACNFCKSCHGTARFLCASYSVERLRVLAGAAPRHKGRQRKPLARRSWTDYRANDRSPWRGRPNSLGKLLQRNARGPAAPSTAVRFFVSCSEARNYVRNTGWADQLRPPRAVIGTDLALGRVSDTDGWCSAANLEPKTSHRKEADATEPPRSGTGSSAIGSAPVE
jgi:hypothetical protein